MNLAVIGTGYVADQYPVTLENHPELELVGAWDHNSNNLDAFLRRWPVRRYSSLDELLGDSSVGIVLNLTNPRSHVEITTRCLEAGKHVYSEKPLAMTLVEAQSLAALAARKGLLLSSAPCSVLSPAARTLRKAVLDGKAGKVRLVYANFEDGMIAPHMQPWRWMSPSGVPWPAKDEFEVGCTYEHAGYVLTWLVSIFGAAQEVTSFASCQIPDKGIPVERMAPDFTVGCIEFAEGVVARVTCGLVAPKDKSITVIGDDGALFVGNVRDDAAPVFLRPAHLSRMQAAIVNRTRGLQRWIGSRLNWPGPEVWFQQKLPPVAQGSRRVVSAAKPVDFLRGPAEMAAAIHQKRPCQLSAEFGLHILEIVEALQHPAREGGRKVLTTTLPS